MLPIPNLSVTGGPGGSSSTGPSTSTTPFAPAYGGFALGGSKTGDASASATAAAIPTWAWIALLAIGALGLLLWFERK